MAAPQTPVSQLQFAVSGSITNQDAGTIYKNSTSLTSHQIAECEAVFAIAIKTLVGSSPTTAQLAAFWRGVFERWDSAKAATKPRYKNRQAADSCVQVGVFKQDLPLGKAKEVQDQRLAGRAAYLKIHVGGIAKNLGWLWVDSANQTVNQAHIQFFAGQTVQSFIKDAMIQYDAAELHRLGLWNTRLTIYIVRRRISHWTRVGYPSAVGGEDELMGQLEEIVLCRNLLSVYEAVASEIRNNGGGSGGIPGAEPVFPVSW